MSDILQLESVTEETPRPNDKAQGLLVSSALLAVSYGGGTNSTAMLCGFKARGIKPALIIFADTGAEMPHTYQHVEIMRAKIREWWGLELVTVMATRKKEPWTIVQDCEKKKLLPALAYGSRSCSQRFKHEPMERYIKKWMRENGVTEIVKCIGYHADEGYRAQGKPVAKQLAKGLWEKYWYPLIEWQWRQEDCQSAICRHGIPQAGKSACYFCPASKRSEVVKLKENHPQLLASALNIEATAQARNRTKIGLGGRGNLWSDWLAMDEAQIKMTLDIEPHEIPCGCVDG
jgi:3'-phosphoadenosine 5'-phosphosulfate sulfotransferase (PAPS reductase)/FAD synthetase